MSEAMLEVQGLTAWYGAAQILFEPSFHVGRGEVVALMGRNGAGKSTTFKALMGLIPQRGGSVRFLGDDISRKHFFNWEYTTDGKSFIRMPSTPEGRTTLEGLTPLTTVGFRVCVTKAKGVMDPWSQVVSFLVR